MCPARTISKRKAISWTWNTRFERSGQAMAEVSKRWFSWADTYGVDIADGEDDVLILASTVVIDMVCHDEHKRVM